MKYNFTFHWADAAIINAPSFLDSPNECLEIGTFEGKFSIWLVENYKCKLTTIDPYDISQYNYDDIDQGMFDDVELNAKRNISNCIYPIEMIKKKSFDALCDLSSQKRKFDFIYVDGSHRSDRVMEDLILSFNLLNSNGTMLLDDATIWKCSHPLTGEIDNDVLSSPRISIDYFIHLYWKQIEILNLPDYRQIAIRKL